MSTRNLIQRNVSTQVWPFSPGESLGPLRFGLSFAEASVAFDLQYIGDLNEQLAALFADQGREKKFPAGYAVSYVSNTFAIELEFDDNGSLSTIYSAESCVVRDIELIGLRLADLEQLWPWRTWPIVDGGVCQIIECPGGLQLTIEEQAIARVTVDVDTQLPPV